MIGEFVNFLRIKIKMCYTFLFLHIFSFCYNDKTKRELEGELLIIDTENLFIPVNMCYYCKQQINKNNITYRMLDKSFCSNNCRKSSYNIYDLQL